LIFFKENIRVVIFIFSTIAMPGGLLRWTNKLI